MWCPERLESSLLTLLSLPSVGHFLAGASLLELSNASSGDGMMQVNWSRSSFPFCGVILKVFLFVCLFVFAPLCCWSFLSGLQNSPRAVFLCGLRSNCWFLLGAGSWCLLIHHLGDKTILNLKVYITVESYPHPTICRVESIRKHC